MSAAWTEKGKQQRAQFLQSPMLWRIKLMALEEEIDKRVLNPDNTELAREDRISQIPSGSGWIVREERVSMYTDPVRFPYTGVAAGTHFCIGHWSNAI